MRANTYIISDSRWNQTSCDSRSFFPLDDFMGSSSGWMNGTTPPWLMITLSNNLCSLPVSGEPISRGKQNGSLFVVADGKKQVTWDDPTLLVVPCSISGELKDLS